MSSIPEPMFQKRRQLSDSYLSGQGIETGALHHPLWVSEQATVRYVDRLSREELRRHYPELSDSFLCAILVEGVASHKAQPQGTAKRKPVINPLLKRHKIFLSTLGLRVKRPEGSSGVDRFDFFRVGRARFRQHQRRKNVFQLGHVFLNGFHLRHVFFPACQEFRGVHYSLKLLT